MYPPAEKLHSKTAAPVYNWFKSNVDGGEEVFNAFTARSIKRKQTLAADEAKM